MNKSMAQLGITIFCFAAIAPSMSTDAEIANRSVSNNNLILAQNSSSTLKTGVYNAGSRYITILTAPHA